MTIAYPAGLRHKDTRREGKGKKGNSPPFNHNAHNLVQRIGGRHGREFGVCVVGGLDMGMVVSYLIWIW